jgi:hypothetical protein
MEYKIKQDFNHSKQCKDQIVSQLNNIQEMIRKSHTSNRSQVRNIRANVCSYHNYNDCRSATMDQKHTISISFKEKEFIFKKITRAYCSRFKQEMKSAFN